jgi:hypothetical protein
MQTSVSLSGGLRSLVEGARVGIGVGGWFVGVSMGKCVGVSVSTTLVLSSVLVPAHIRLNCYLRPTEQSPTHSPIETPTNHPPTPMPTGAPSTRERKPPDRLTLVCMSHITPK